MAAGAGGSRMPSRRPMSESFSRTSAMRRLAEIADFQQLLLRPAHQVADGGDVLRLQAVRRPDRQLQLRQAHVQFGFRRLVDADGAGGAGFAMHHRPQFVVLHERVQVLAEDLGRLDQRHLRRDRAVGPDFDGQLVVVGLLADAGFLDLVANANHRAERGVDRNNADLLRLRRVLRGRHVSAAVLHHHFQQERHVLGQRGDHEILVDDFDLVVGADVGAGDRAFLVLLDPHDAGLLAVVLHHQRLHVQHDVGHVFDHAGQRAELVLGAVHLDLGHGAAFEARKQDAAKAVADRHPEAALERLGDELAVGGGKGRSLDRNQAGQFQAAPSNTHGKAPIQLQ